MNSNNKTTQEDMKAILSTLWIFLLFNMAFADIFGFMYPGYMAQIVAGTPIDGMQITPIVLLISAIIIEIPIAMIFLSRLLKYGINRWVNIIGGFITIVFVIGMGSPTALYMFFATIEVVCALVIIWMAWKWKPAIEPSTGS